MTAINKKDIIRDFLLLVFLVFIAGYLTTPHNPFLTGAPVHPYLFVVVLIAIRYGTLPGIEAAIALTVLYLTGGLALRGVNALPPILDLPHSMTICALFVLAVIVGYFYDTFRHKLMDAEAKNRESAEQLKFLGSHNRLLLKANQELRSRIMEETTTFQTLYEMAKKLATLEPKFLYPAVLEIIDNHLKAESCSFYLLKGDMLHLVAQRGWESVPPEAKAISIEDGMIGQLIQNKKLVSLKDLTYQEGLDLTEKVMAVPVISQNGDEVIGAIAIEKIPFEQFNQQTVRTFNMVAEWTSRALANVALFSKAEYEMSERDHRLSELRDQLNSAILSEATFNHIDSLGDSVMPRLGELLLDPSLNPGQKSNLLSILERFQHKGKYLKPDEYRTFAVDSLNNWYSLERYKEAAQKEDQSETELLTAYTEEQQDLYHSFAGRSLAIMLAGESGGHTIKGEDIMDGKIMLDEEITVLINTMREGDRQQISNIIQKRLGRGPESFRDLLPELLASPNPWLKATSIYGVGRARRTDLVPEVMDNIKDEDPMVRETCIVALARLTGISGDSNLAVIFQSMADDDPDPGVRKAAKTALAMSH